MFSKLIAFQIAIGAIAFILALFPEGNLSRDSLTAGIVAGHILLLATHAGMTSASLIRRSISFLLGIPYLCALTILAGDAVGDATRSFECVLIVLVPYTAMTIACRVIRAFYAEISENQMPLEYATEKEPFQLSILQLLSFTAFTAVLLGLGQIMRQFLPSQNALFFLFAGLVHATCMLGLLYMLIWSTLTTLSNAKRRLVVLTISPFLGSVFPALLLSRYFVQYAFWVIVYFLSACIATIAFTALKRLHYSITYTRSTVEPTGSSSDQDQDWEITKRSTEARLARFS